MKEIMLSFLLLLVASGVSAEEVDTNLVKTHLDKIVLTEKPRNL